MLKWSLEEIKLPFKFNDISIDGQINFITNFVVTVEFEELAAISEFSLNLFKGETKETIYEEFDNFVDNVPNELDGLESLIQFIEGQSISSSLKAGLECAFMHYLALLSERSVHELLSINLVQSVDTSYSIPDMNVGRLSSFICENNLSRFSSLKVNVNEDNFFDVIQEIRKQFCGKLRIDCGENWSDVDSVIKIFNSLPGASYIDYVEQPLLRSMHDEYLYLKKNIDLKIIADESVFNEEITSYHSERFDGINIRLSKSGGYVSAIRQIRTARGLGLKVSLETMKESGLGVANAVNIAHNVDYINIGSHLLFKDNPYPLVAEENGRLFFAYMQ